MIVLIGEKRNFAIEIGKDECAYQMSLYIEGKDILQFEIQGKIYPHRWRSLGDIMEWIQENLKYILGEDDFPLVTIIGDSAAQLCDNADKWNVDDCEACELVNDWMFRHSWFSAREGAFLADVFFRKVNDSVEISWDNTNTFKSEGVRFIYPKGRYEVEKNAFKRIMQNVCMVYRTL